ncbi:MAG: response regulator transcription factor [Clostridiales bacterium]|nr:response regulator transcription factor [Clostridiales bacterium]
MPNVLIADDEKEIVRLLKIYLESEHFTIFEAYNGADAYDILQKENIDLAIVDIMMPLIDGYELIRKIRKGKYIPILVISAKTQLSDRILGIDLGADDYIVKPFEPLEVAAKVKAHMRRVTAQRPACDNRLTAGGLTLDRNACTLIKDGNQIDLTKAEFKVLELLMEQPGRVFTKEQIYEHAWFNEGAVDDNTIRVVISRLRDKAGAGCIKTIRGLGYRLENHG